MKILQLTRDYIGNGGIGAYVRGLTGLLRSDHHQVAVICSEGLPDGSSVPVSQVPHFDGFSDPAARATRERVLAIAAEFEPDVVLIHAMDDYALVRLLRARYAVANYVHNHQYCSSGLDYVPSSGRPCDQPQGAACVRGFLPRRCWRVRNPATAAIFYRRSAAAVSSLRSSALVFVASRYVRERLLRNGVPPERVMLSPYFPDVPGMTKESLCPRPAGGTLLFVGRVVPEKGLDYLLRSLQGLPGAWRLVVNGDGPHLSQAVTLARRLGLCERTEFVGWTSRERLLEWYEAADIVVVPSIWPEPFGLVGIEAMAYGKPVVAFRSGAIPEWLEHGETGFLAENGDVVELRERIRQLLEDPSLRLRMGLAGCDRVSREFSRERHAAIVLEGLRRLVQNRSGVLFSLSQPDGHGFRASTLSLHSRRARRGGSCSGDLR